MLLNRKFFRRNRKKILTFWKEMPYHGFINMHTACGRCAKIVRKVQKGVFSWGNQQWMRLQGLDCVINLHTQRVTLAAI